MDDDDEFGDELKGLAVLYAMLCFINRELTRLDAPCEDAESAVATAQAAIRARMLADQADDGEAEGDPDGQALLH
jgi:hypothetical protein